MISLFLSDGFLFLSIHVSLSLWPPVTLLHLLIVLIPSPTSTSLIAFLSHCSSSPTHTRISHQRVLLVLLTRVVMTRSLAITEGRACKVVMAVLVQ